MEEDPKSLMFMFFLGIGLSSFIAIIALGKFREIWYLNGNVLRFFNSLCDLPGAPEKNPGRFWPPVRVADVATFAPIQKKKKLQTGL